MGDNESNPLDAFGPDLDIAPEEVESRISAQQSQTGATKIGGRVAHDSQDPSYIQRMEHFEGIPHQEMYEKAQDMKPGMMHQVGDIYVEIANKLSGGLLGAHLALNRAHSDGIEGEFAAAAADSAKRFYEQATDVQEVLHAVGRRLKAAAYGAEVVKASVPPASTSSGTGPPAPGSSAGPQELAGMLAGAAAPGDLAAQESAKEEQRQVAIGVMNSVYKPTYQPAGDGVPTYIPVQGPGDNPQSPPGTPGGPGSPGSPSGPAGNPTGGQPNGEQPEGGQPASEQPQGEQPGSQEDPTAPANANQNPSGQNPQQQGAPPGSPGDPSRNPTTPAGAPTGGPSSPGGPGSPSGPGSPGGAPPPPGRSIPGAPAAPGGPGAGNPAAAHAGAPGTGRAGMPGMMPPGGGQKGRDDESDRKTPDYLVGNREEELLGERPSTVPEALGSDAPSNRPSGVEGGDQR